MKLNEIFSKKRILFLLLFIAMVFAGNRINFSAVVGTENQFFTLFQFFGPIAGGFLGGIFGAVAVLFAQLIDYIVVGKAFTLINVIRLAPMIFAAIYFAVLGAKSRKIGFGKFIAIAVPAACMVLFVIHPVGREAWYFSLYWLIPILAVIMPERVPGKLFFRSYGATFTAHAIGSTAWLYTVPMTAAQWTALVPVVAYERLLFGAGIAFSYILVTTVLDKFVEKAKLSIPNSILNLEKRYDLINIFHVRH